MVDAMVANPTMQDLLRIRSQYLRSVQIERDYEDPNASRHYVVTPFVAATFERLAQSLSFATTARAWRLTGDYGSGKSSFVLAFARYATGALNALPADLGRTTASVRLEPVLVVGEREPVGRSLLRALRKTLSRMDLAPSRSLLKRLSEAEDLTVPALLEAVSSVGDWVRTCGVASGLLIVFDELGKNLEYAAATPDHGDLQLLQDLAEASVRSGVAPLVTIAILHQAVTAYAQDLSSAERREWEKVSGRFEEIVFVPPLEQGAALTAAALGVDAQALPRSLVKQTREQMRIAGRAGWYGPGAMEAELEPLAAGLAPLDAFVLPVLARALRRFGQNERSLFSFLSSSEPGGLLAHTRQPLAGYVPFRLNNLYDYLAQNLAGSLESGSRGVRWGLVEGVVRSAVARDEFERNALKAVGLVNLLDDPSLCLTEDLLISALASSADDRRRVSAAVHRLRNEARVLYDRGAGGGLCLWPHTSVDLQKAFEEGLAAVTQGSDVLAVLRPILPSEPLVARRHYVMTGAMRHFEVVYVPSAALSGRLEAAMPNRADGQVLVALSRTERERDEALAIIHAHADWPDTRIVGVAPPIGTLAPLLRDLNAWQWVAEQTPALSGDRLAREEVSRQIAGAEDRLRRALSALFDFKGGGAVSTQWLHRGKTLAVHSGRELTEALSNVCDEAFSKSPIITNELLNRRQLSSAAARARSLLMEGLAQAPDKASLGLDDQHMPPEMAAYMSILGAGNVHVRRSGRWQVVRPDPDPLNIAPSLDRIAEVLQRKEDRRVPYEEVAEALRASPYGVRDGLIPLLIAVYLAAYWHHTAVYEDETYLEQVGGPEFARILKEPEHFALQHCAIEGVRTAVFSRLAAVVGVPGEATELDLLDVVRPLLQFVARLPDHARRTRNLSVMTAAVRNVLLRVRDPSAMLFHDLPRACGLDPFSADDAVDEQRLDSFVTAIAASVHELHGAYPALLDRISVALARATEAAGGAETLHAALARRAERLINTVAEPELKSFALRLADLKLTSKAWLESVASFLARKPPERWAEVDEREFYYRLKLLARRFIRVEAALVTDAGQLEGAPGLGVYRLVITSADGRELEDLVRGDVLDDTVAKLERQFSEMLSAYGRTALLAVARALVASKAEDIETHDN
ncbi:hypothetical protein [Telmatospirillum siberiense]|uniref:ATP-binding protein n=1 Tax=Telmatospirillum siberiense TaxID=382514 RepID=A0A2N3PR94_9PROT|nr:hypothetical protein [Telmatospirillum siberiense]PKU22915.1 hypothetical protein CWS72_18840 [Telmatospirillum siberiense]